MHHAHPSSPHCKPGVAGVPAQHTARAHALSMPQPCRRRLQLGARVTRAGPQMLLEE